jgi:hypothetical protein
MPAASEREWSLQGNGLATDRVVEVSRAIELPMRARVVLAGLVALSTVVLAEPASAKPAIIEVRISGPSLDGTIRIHAPDRDGLWESGIDLGGALADFRADSVRELGLAPADLGPRYLVTYRFQSSNALIRQDLHPYAKDGPVTYTPPGQRLTGRARFSITAGWYHSSPGFLGYLVELGLPKGNPVAPVAVDEPAMHAARGNNRPPWEGVAVLLGLAALCLGALRTRRRRLAAGPNR